MDMTSTPFGSGLSPGAMLPGAGRASFGQASVSAMSMRWSALHDAAETVAGIAGVAAEPMTADLRNFPSVMRDAGGWRHELAEQGVADLSAMMVPGLAALLQAHARGVAPVAAAEALWHEFVLARDGLLALQPREPKQQARVRFT